MMRKILITSIMLVTIVSFELGAMQKATKRINVSSVKAIHNTIDRFSKKNMSSENAIEKFSKQYIVPPEVFHEILSGDSSQHTCFGVSEIEDFQMEEPDVYKKHIKEALYKCYGLEIPRQKSSLGKAPKLIDFRIKMCKKYHEKEKIERLVFGLMTLASCFGTVGMMMYHLSNCDC